MNLASNVKFASITAGIAALVAAVSFASFAAAAVTPTVDLTVRNSSNAQISSASVGDSVYARVAVASSTASTSPTGTVDFNWYAGQSCLGTATTQNNVSLSSGIATSNMITVPSGGLSFKAHYDGQSDLYSEADSNCVSLSADQNNSALSLTLSDNTIATGEFVYAIPNLTNETSEADGTIMYKVYNNNTCTDVAINAGSKTVTNGATPNSESYQFITPGTYYWQAVYSGDISNEAATSSCAGAVLTVNATTTPTPSTPGTISGTVYNDLNKDDSQNNGESGLSGWKVWLHKAATTTKNSKKNKGHDYYDDPIIATATTDANGNYSFGNLAAGTYFVEEEEKKGWKQTSSDMKVVLTSSNTSADVDFSNVQKKKAGKGNNNDNGNNNGTSTNNGGNNGNNGNGNNNHGGYDKGDNYNDDRNGRGNKNGWFKDLGNFLKNRGR
ncbi:hypothetical protein H7X87_01550 [Acetobacteraceae bacterium]|nr:hypothetical protein [Candidatus Parcubacteria bacterium]